MPVVHLVSTGCSQDRNALGILPPCCAPNACIVFARLDLKQLNDEPHQGGQFLWSCGYNGEPDAIHDRRKIKPMYEYARERWANPIFMKIDAVLTSGSCGGLLFVIVACRAGHHRSVATVECLRYELPKRIAGLELHVWHWSYICEAGLFTKAWRNMVIFLRKYFPNRFLELGWDEDPDGCVETSIGLEALHGTIKKVFNTTRYGGALQAYGFIEYHVEGKGERDIFFHTDEIHNWVHVAWDEPPTILRSLIGTLVQFCIGNEQHDPKAVRIFVFPHSLSSDQLARGLSNQFT